MPRSLPRSRGAAASGRKALALSPEGEGLPRGWVDAAVDLMAEAGRKGTFRVEGVSMLPTLRAGDAVAIEFAPQGLRAGDLLLFHQADYLAVHRLLGSARLPDGGEGYRTRGDGVSRLDPAVAPRSVVGRVLALRRGDDDWRDARRPAARLYGRALALHDLFWAAADAVATAVDRRLGGGDQGLLHRLVARADRGTLRVAHGLLFNACHRPVRLESLDR